MKNTAIALYLLFLYFSLSAQTNIDSLELLKTQRTGIEKIKVINTLASVLKIAAPKTAIQYTKESIYFSELINTVEEKATALCIQGDAYFELNDLTLAVEAYKRACEIFLKLKNETSLLEYYDKIKRLSKLNKDFSTSLQYDSLMLGIYEKKQSKDDVLSILGSLAETFNLQGNFEKTIELETECMKLARDLNKKLQAAQSLNQIGNVYASLGFYDKAVDNFLDGLKLARDINEKGMVQEILLTLGLVFKKFGLLEESLSYLSECVSAKFRNVSEHRLREAFYLISEIHLKLGNLDLALLNAEEASKLIEIAESESDQIEVLTLLGKIYQQKKSFQDALHHFEQALEKSKQNNLDETAAEILGSIGVVNWKLNRKRDGIKKIEESINLARRGNYFSVLKKNYLNLSDIYKSDGNDKKALGFYKLYSEIRDSLLINISNSKIADLKLRFEYEKNKNENEILRRNNEIQKLEIEQKQNIISAAIVITLLLVILAIVLYGRYRANKKANKLLHDQNILITSKSEILAYTLKELENYSSRNDALIQAVPDIILILSSNGKYKDCKIEQSGKKKSEAAKYDQSLPELLIREVKEKLEVSENFSHEFQFVSGDELKYFEARLARLNNDETLAIVRDITSNKIAERKLIEAKETAIKSNELKSEFLAQVSHEIKTPINTIINFNEIIKDELNEVIDDDLKSNFEYIDIAAKRISRTINLIVDMAVIQSETYDYQPSEIDLRTDIINNVLEDFELVAKEKNICLKISDGCDDRIVADRYCVTQIFSNLIDNAIKFTETGSVEIIVRRNEVNNLIVEVKDTGIGISKKYLKTIFETFSQEDHGYSRRFDGNGIGLSLVRSYCELNGATLEIKSERGKGSNFIVTFNN